jgi:hypothetical protein
MSAAELVEAIEQHMQAGKQRGRSRKAMAVARLRDALDAQKVADEDVRRKE